jgi:pimeloyl-ACP methyl ester carboxylesterase
MSSRGQVDADARPPVLFLTGVGLTAAVALRAVAALEAAHFRVLAAQPKTAEDAVAVLDDSGVRKAHVVGLSVGGVPAQELAIQHPRRVRSLVLASSSGGGERYVSPEPAIRRFLDSLHELPAEEGLWASVPYLYSATTRAERAPLIGEDIARRLSCPLDPRAYRRQVAIMRAYTAGARLRQISAPTLVIHGEQDRILPLENGRRLAEAIPGARLITLPGAHAFPTDVPDAGEALVSFLVAQSQPPPRRAAVRSARADHA